ncbi:hypothetical protein PVAP13_4KG240010 [Panicum virgatum]|uniref:Uncharacterized protein n=1 Tax=Panicum virgatum TaxID=38727 RepID=A0A8T0TI93_PANVG|nr:hypothetical protein PVAP13_4KG240010 [Panicum virgatum]
MGPHIFFLRFFSNRHVYPQPRRLFLWPHPASATSPSRLPSVDYPLHRFSCAGLRRLPCARSSCAGSQEPGAQAPHGTHLASFGGLLPLHPARGPRDLGVRTPPHDTAKAHPTTKDPSTALSRSRLADEQADEVAWPAGARGPPASDCAGGRQLSEHIGHAAGRQSSGYRESSVAGHHARGMRELTAEAAVAIASGTRLVPVQSSLGGALLLTSDEMKNRGKKNGRWKGMTCGVRMPVSGERITAGAFWSIR